MNPLVVLSIFTIWSAISSYYRFKGQTVEARASTNSSNVEGASSGSSSIHSPSLYLAPHILSQILSFSRSVDRADHEANFLTTSDRIGSPKHEYLGSFQGKNVLGYLDDSPLPAYRSEIAEATDAEHYRQATLKSSSLHGGRNARSRDNPFIHFLE